jgi:hypothetical protein
MTTLDKYTTDPVDIEESDESDHVYTDENEV